MSMVMTLEAFLFFQPLRRLTNNFLTLVKAFDRYKGSINLVEGGETLRGTLGLIRRANLRRGIRRAFYP